MVKMENTMPLVVVPLNTPICSNPNLAPNRPKWTKSSVSFVAVIFYSIIFPMKRFLFKKTTKVNLKKFFTQIQKPASFPIYWSILVVAFRLFGKFDF